MFYQVYTAWHYQQTQHGIEMPFNKLDFSIQLLIQILIIYSLSIDSSEVKFTLHNLYCWVPIQYTIIHIVSIKYRQ